MIDKEQKSVMNLNSELDRAIKELDAFTRPKTNLKQIIALTRLYMASLLSRQFKHDKDSELNRLKRMILAARNTIQKHSAVIDQYRSGSDSERKFAEYALSAIERYNAIVKEKKNNSYNDPKQCLLCDPEIQGQEIILSHAIPIKHDLSAENDVAKKILEKLHSPQPRIEGQSRLPTIHKTNSRFVIDVFKIKALGKLKLQFRRTKVCG